MARANEQEISTYKELMKDRLEVDQVKALGAPAYPGLTIFKVFAYLLRRIVALEELRENRTLGLLDRIAVLESKPRATQPRVPEPATKA